MTPTDEQRLGEAPVPPATAPPPVSFSSWAWVPIRSLAARHRPRIATHLLALDAHDRYLRFGYTATDEQIAKYVDTIDFERDEVFGIFNRRLELIAMTHLAYRPPVQHGDPDTMAEFGVSVLAKARGRGYGGRLFEHAVLHARNRGVETLFIHALTENTAMLKIARRAGASVERNGSETEAWLKLPPDSLVSRLGEMVETQAAEIDYQLKRQAQRVNGILESLGEVKTHIENGAPTASE
ncbi:MAG TPA: GNAT family N-acetyltransferase [Albitalea sp.]|jgi:RimJ/RimL family protein N-acetyltransferase|nr:GNAT family N-acetyltransferase [Albitalea sp.]